MVSTGRGGGGFHPPLANPPLQRLHGDRQRPRSIASGDELGSVGHRSSLDRLERLKRRSELYSSIELNESFGSDRRSSMGELVYAVHATRPEEVGSVEVIFEDEQAARRYACDRSTDHRVLAVSVTSFVLGQFGSRHPLAWFRDGVIQEERAKRPGSLYPAEPWHGNGTHT
jgi:hypothetical protein